MSTYRDIKSSRRLIWAGTVLGYALAAAIAVANLVGGDGTMLTAISLFIGFAIPSSLALLSLDRRPSLLGVAIMGAVLQGVILITSVGLVEFVPAIMWALASRKRPRPAIAPRGASWLRPLLAAATVLPLLVMFLHLDPVCVITTPDGKVTEAAYEQAPTGWGFAPVSSGTTSSSTNGDTTSCTTNRVVAWEAGLSIAVSVAYLALATAYWPTANQIIERRHRTSGRLV